MKKVVYIIPGFGHSPKMQIYKDVSKLFENKGFKVILVKIDWNYKSIFDWVEQFKKDYFKDDKSEKYLFGFSYGAVISFLVSIDKDINTTILCSLSPYFKEDLPNIFKSWKKNIGKKRVEDFKKLEMTKLAPSVKNRTYLMYGTSEGRFIERRAKDTYERLDCKKYLISVDGARHDIGNKKYQKEIKKVINSL